MSIESVAPSNHLRVCIHIPNFPNYARYIKTYFSYYKTQSFFFFSIYNFPFLLKFAVWQRNTESPSKLLACICQSIYCDSWTLLFHFTKSKVEQQTLLTPAFIRLLLCFINIQGSSLLFILILIKKFFSHQPGVICNKKQQGADRKEMRFQFHPEKTLFHDFSEWL